ncbi:uncharacterized membrane protein YidH (DUF202 family) [Prauserella muralis]|nr:uncharacterized membrane protein YidH (DUF202 family) [Prauserella muralis]
MSDGLQPERTGLAWQRSALAAGACALLLLHAASRHGWGLLSLPGALCAATAAVLAVGGGRREQHLRHESEPAPVSHLLVLAVAALVLATAATSLVTFLL